METGMQRALDLIAECKRTKATFLDLGNLNLKELPEEVKDLDGVERLNLGVKYKDEDGKWIWAQGYKNINDAIHNRNQISDIDHLKELQNLTSLDLSNNQISDIDHLKELQNLTSLNLSINQISDIDHLKELQNLTSLNLSFNQISDIDHLKELQNLTSLDLRSNQISDIDHLKELQNLTSLDLSNNQILDIDHLKELQNLSSLNLSSNQITDIHNILAIIENFEKIDLRSSFTRDGVINLTNNPIEIPPPEIVRQGIEAVQNYFQEIKQDGIDYLFEAKMLVIGEGGAGKTSLCQKILNAEYRLRPEMEDKSTEGIDIMQHRFPLANNRDFTVNLWDFGGQEVYHSTHQFFLTKRSMYILVTDSRKDDTDLQYWLHVQQLLAGDSPVLIVQNEKQDRIKDLKQNEIRGAFKNVKGFLRTNLKDNRGLAEIVKTVETQLQTLPHIGDELPKTWVRIRQTLEARPESHISRQEYLAICKNAGIDDKDRAYWLSSYLHDLGVILHFQDDPILERIIILDNEWGTDAVYRVIDTKQVIAQKGRFDMADLKEIWQEELYRGYELELVRLMEKFKLCYPLKDNQAYIAPQLLPVDKPVYEWDSTGSLQLKYQYDFMPKGILSRLIVEVNEYIKDGIVWNTGVLLEKDGAIAEVMETYAKNEITINVKGSNPESLRAVVMHEIDEINMSFQNLQFEKLVPCNCRGCVKKSTPHFFKESQLSERKLYGKNKIECGQPPYHEADVLNLLNAIHTFDHQAAESDPHKSAWRHRIGYEDLDVEMQAFLRERNEVIIRGKIAENYANSALNKEKKTSDPSTPKIVKKKFYEQWWFHYAAGSFIGGLIIGLLLWRFLDWNYFDGLLIGFSGLLAILFFNGNPNKRHFRSAKYALAAAIGLTVINLEGTFDIFGLKEQSGFKLSLNWVSEFDWLIALALIGLAAYLFWMDWKNSYQES